MHSTTSDPGRPRAAADIEAVILKVLGDLLQQQGDDDVAVDRATRLFGSEGALDSLGLVSLIVGVEQALQDELGVTVSLADEKALSQRHSPYRTVGSLAEYAANLM